MEIEIYTEGMSTVVSWGAKGVYIKFDSRKDAHEFAREMVATFTGVSV